MPYVSSITICEKHVPRITRVKHHPTYFVVQQVRVDGISDRFGQRQPTFSKRKDIQSRKSTTRLGNAMNWLLLFADSKRVYEKKRKKTFSFKLAFITLTLSDAQKHSDAFIKNHMLQPFLYWLTRYYHCSYVWKAEAQLNGNIHFHITIDTFVHWKSVRAKWNSILSKYQYCKVYQDGTNDRGNAATDIKSVRAEKELARYIANYMSKKNTYDEKKYKKIKCKRGDEKLNCFSIPSVTFLPANSLHFLRFISGRLWGCSESLSNINCYTDELSANFEKEMREFENRNKCENLRDVLIERDEKLYSAMSLTERGILQVDSLSIAHKYEPLRYTFIHKNYKYLKLPPMIQSAIAEIKLSRKFPTQKYFTVDSFK